MGRKGGVIVAWLVQESVCEQRNAAVVVRVLGGKREKEGKL